MASVLLICPSCGHEHDIEVSVIGEDRPAAWGYWGGTPPEYAELEYDFPESCESSVDTEEEPCLYVFTAGDRQRFEQQAWKEIEENNYDPREDDY